MGRADSVGRKLASDRRQNKFGEKRGMKITRQVVWGTCRKTVALSFPNRSSISRMEGARKHLPQTHLHVIRKERARKCIGKKRQ